MSRIASLQDPFLNALRKEKISVSIYLVNGIKLQGIIEAFDQFSIVLLNNVNQMVYKHAISTVVPSKAVRLIYSNYSSNNHQNRNSEQQDNDIFESPDDPSCETSSYDDIKNSNQNHEQDSIPQS